MPVGVPLSELRRELRAETGQSLTVTQGVNYQDATDLMLARQQRELWSQYEWAHLKLVADVALAPGQRLYNYPAALPFPAINKVFVQDGTRYAPLGYGISAADYEVYGGISAQSWPVQKWANVVSVDPGTGRTDPFGQMEVWPVPSQAGALRVEGQAPLNPLALDTDTCTLDSTLIVLFAAAEILAAQKAENASLKLQKAQTYLRRLLANQGSDKRRMYSLAGPPGAGPQGQNLTPYIDYIPMK